MCRLKCKWTNRFKIYEQKSRTLTIYFFMELWKSATWTNTSWTRCPRKNRHGREVAERIVTGWNVLGPLGHLHIHTRRYMLKLTALNGLVHTSGNRVVAYSTPVCENIKRLIRFLGLISLSNFTNLFDFICYFPINLTLWTSINSFSFIPILIAML